MSLSKLPFALGILLMVGLASATSVSVGSTTQQARVGFVDGVYFVNSNSLGSTTPAVNTAQTTPVSTGSYGVPKGSSAYLWSPQFASATTVPAGTWVLDLWAAGSKSGVPTISIYVTDSTGATTATIASNVNTPTIGTSATQAVTTVSGGSATIPAGGYINVVINNPTSQHITTLTVYWGSGQATNFQAPLAILTS